MRITYISHSCFTLENDHGVVLLFDYPSGRMLEPGAKEIVKEVVKDSRLYVFISHSHGDHFNPDVKKLAENAKSVEYIVSDDVSLRDVDVIGPGEELSLKHMDVETFASNDAGLAFIIRLGDMRIYYGGDLARWDWDDFDEDTRWYMVEVFEKMIDHLSKSQVDVAFSNVDQRLGSWAGPLEFLEVVEPEYFIPMHTFGNVEWIDDLVKRTDYPAERIFRYKKPGDLIVIE